MGSQSLEALFWMFFFFGLSWGHITRGFQKLGSHFLEVCIVLLYILYYGAYRRDLNLHSYRIITYSPTPDTTTASRKEPILRTCYYLLISPI